MNQRGILIIILSILIAFTVVVVSFLGLYRFYPELFGVNRSTDSLEIDSIYTEPLLTISKQQMYKYQTELLGKDLLKFKKDSLEKASKDLSKSLNKIQNKIKHLNDSISHFNETLNLKRKGDRALKDSIRKLQREFKKANQDKLSAEEQIKSNNKLLNSKVDSTKLANIKAFAKMYNTASSDGVAKILEKLEPKQAAMILKFMQKKKAGKVLEVMKPERAAEILLQGNITK